MNEARILTPAQATLLLEVAKGMRNAARDTAILALCLDAGPRRAELIDLCRRDLDADTGRLIVGTGPTTRVIRLGVEALAAIRAVAPDDRTGPLIPSREGVTMTPRIVHEQLLAIGTYAGLPFPLTARDTRRTFVAAIAERHPLPIAMRIAGHGSTRYPAADLWDAVEAQDLSGWGSPLDGMIREARWSGLGRAPRAEERAAAA